MTSAAEPDHRSANLLKFHQLAPRIHEGPQGVELRDFIELFHEESALTHFGVVPSPSHSSGRFTFVDAMNSLVKCASSKMQ